MLPAILAGFAAIALAQAPATPAPAPSPADLAAYEAQRAGVGRDPDAQVRLALWCEAHGLHAQRFRHLALAVLADPSHAAARGLMGLVAFGGRWQSPEAVKAKVGEDAGLHAALAEYNARRESVPDTADAQWRLAAWCEENGLDAEAKAHLTAVVRLDPSRDAAWKRLGCRKHDGRWMTEARIAAERAEAEAQKQGDKRWRPLLSRWRGWLGDPARRDEAERSLAGVADPHAVASVWAAFVAGRANARDHARAVQLLGQIDAPRASLALAMLAVSSDSAEVRRTATETLRRRDTREYLGAVIAQLRKKVRYEVRPVDGPGSPGVLFVEGQQYNVRRVYAPPAMPDFPIFAGEPVGYDAFGLPVISRYLGSSIETRTELLDQKTTILNKPMPRPDYATIRAAITYPDRVRSYRPSETTTTTRTTTAVVDHSVQIPIGQLMAQYQTAALVAQQQQGDDIRAIEESNAEIGRRNDRVTQVLRGVTGADRGEDSEAWSAWWLDNLGYAFTAPQSQPVPTYVENVPLAYLPTGIAPSASDVDGPSKVTTLVSNTSSPGGFSHNCFRAGTPVRTLAGPRAIEMIRVGDRVLTQDVRTGALGYQPVLAVFHNRPAETLRIDLDGGETIVATTIHRFWKAGQGWVMARDLEPGDTLRTLGGTARVRSVEPDRVQPVFNLQVAEGGSFFVGEAGTLAHDNSLVEPVAAPFDAPARRAE